jgi:hypothetical protein
MGLLKASEADLNHAGSSFHSSFVIILVCGGVLGLITFVLALGNIYLTHKNLLPYLMLLLLLSLSDNIILHPFILFLFIFLVSDS